MKRVVFLFTVVSLSSLLGCASTPPAKGPAEKEAAAMQELKREREAAQPAPTKPAKSQKSQKSQK
jgi:hypothetical protein